MTASQLSLYNGALEILGVPRLSSVSSTDKSRYEIDAVYSEELAAALRDGDWNFAMRSTEEDSDGTPTVHHFTYYHSKPSDWVRTVMLSASDSFQQPLLEYEDEAGKWYSNVDPLYAKYVSNDSSYGGDITLFPQDYQDYIHHRIAKRVCIALTGSRTMLNDVKDDLRKARSKALAIDARDGPPRPKGRPGSWVESRGFNVGDTRINRADS